MAFLGKHFHVCAACSPVIGNALRCVELVDGSVAKAGLPALALRKRRGEAQRLTSQHGRGDWDGAHGLHATGQHHILRAAHHRLRRKMNGLLG